MNENVKKLFDSKILAEFRKANNGKRIRIDSIAKSLGITKEDVKMVKNNKEMSVQYKDALEQSLFVCKGKSIHEDFLERISEWKQNENWTHLDVIGYFCYMYEKINNVDFIFEKCKNPFKTKDTKMAAKVVGIFKTKEKIKNYIDWIFEAKQKSGFKVFGISALTSGWLINEFNVYCSKNKKITRTTILPENFLNWCILNIPEIFEAHELKTYGHLNTMIGMIKNGTKDEIVYKAVRRAEEMNIIRERK